MRHRGFSACAALLACAFAMRAAGLNVPELGIVLPDLPDGASTTDAIHRDGGYQLDIHYYTALLTIYRDDASAAPGSDVASPAYRLTLVHRFGDRRGLESEGAPTAIGGVSGWTVVEALPVAGNAQATHYLCLTYLIAAGHLYRLSVTAEGEGHRPAEFDGLVRLLSRFRFTAIPAHAGPILDVS